MKGIKENQTSKLLKCISLFKEYEYQVVAEGVETENQLKLLKELGIDFVQGYYYSRPVSVEALNEAWKY